MSHSHSSTQDTADGSPLLCGPSSGVCGGVEASVGGDRPRKGAGAAAAADDDEGKAVGAAASCSGIVGIAGATSE